MKGNGGDQFQSSLGKSVEMGKKGLVIDNMVALMAIESFVVDIRIHSWSVYALGSPSHHAADSLMSRVQIVKDLVA